MSPRRTGHLVSRTGMTALVVLVVATWRISGAVPGLEPLVRVLHTRSVQEYGTWLALVGLLLVGLLVLWHDDADDTEDDETGRAGHRDLSGSHRP